jgi:hypothetical protein
MVIFHSYVNIYQRVTTGFSQMFIVDIYRTSWMRLINQPITWGHHQPDFTSAHYLPRASRAVPHAECVHSIFIKRILHPLSQQADELCIVEVKFWRPRKVALHWILSPQSTLDRRWGNDSVCRQPVAIRRKDRNQIRNFVKKSALVWKLVDWLPCKMCMNMMMWLTREWFKPLKRQKLWNCWFWIARLGSSSGKGATDKPGLERLDSFEQRTRKRTWNVASRVNHLQAPSKNSSLLTFHLIVLYWSLLMFCCFKMLEDGSICFKFHVCRFHRCFAWISNFQYIYIHNQIYIYIQWYNYVIHIYIII